MNNSQETYQLQTDSGREFDFVIRDWLQDTHLSSEAIYRITREGLDKKEISFSPDSWPKSEHDNFSMKPKQLIERLEKLQQNYWNNQFVFLETIWEGYLENLIREIAKKLPEVLEDLCRKHPSPEVMNGVLTKSTDLGELQEIVVEWLSSQFTRQPWADQWKAIEKLNIGIPANKFQRERWWVKLDIYFEMRNCIIHRQCRASISLRLKDSKIGGVINLKPRELEFFQIQFRNAVSEIDKALGGRLNSKNLRRAQ